MSSFWVDFAPPHQAHDESPERSPNAKRTTRFSDASMGGISFDVRKVTVSSFPHGLDDAALDQRQFVIVKQPRLDECRRLRLNTLEEIATELQILRHERIAEHPHILNLVGIVYHNASRDPGSPYILPALVVEYAEWGNLRSYLAQGLGHSMQERFDICQDIASGLEHLHSFGIVHCDIKDTNMLVCSDKIRKVVVKISDFGFALSLLDYQTQLIGFTSSWEAPEIHQPLDRNRLCQLDIYSYGLLFYTVMKKGTLFYEAADVEDHAEQLLKMKISNLLSATMQMNLLVHMKHERCMLLIICRILRFSLDVDVEKRFQTMHDLTALLKQCNPSDLSRENNLENPLYQVHNFGVGHYASAKGRILKLFHDSIDAYQNELEHMKSALRNLFEERFNIEIDMFMDKPGVSDDVNYRCCPGMELILFRSLLGVLPSSNSTRNHKDASRTGSLEMSHFFNVAEFDLPEYYDVLQRFNSSVKRFIFVELEAIYRQQNDLHRQAFAAYNLSYCYIEGIGVQPDCAKGLQLLHQAGDLGSLKAQGYIIRICTARRQLERLEETTFRQWAVRTVQENRKQSLQVLQSVDSDAWLKLKKDWGTDRSLQLETVSVEGHENQSNIDLHVCEGRGWRAKLLHFASATGMTQLARDMVLLEERSIESRNMYGQTPLIVAFQSGSLEIVLFLLKRGADIEARDAHGFTALHWLVSFSDSEKTKLASHLPRPIEGVNFFGQIPIPISSENPSPNLQGGPVVTGTPLHWAVAYLDTIAVNILLDLGADASRQQRTETRSPFEQACSAHAAGIIDRLLKETSIKTSITQYQNFGGGLYVNPMFWVLAGSSRFVCLLKHGFSFQQEVERVMGHLVGVGVAVDAVLQKDSASPKMSAPFATAYHRCPVELMRAGLKNGFRSYLDTTFGMATSGGPAMSLAIAHNDRELFSTLLEAGASVEWRNVYKQSALSMVAKETDDVWFATRLLEKGVPVDDAEDPMSAFFFATYSGNLNVARFLWTKGARRDSRDPRGKTILGSLIQMRTRNAANCVRFILGLPDRNESDGFIVFHATDGTGHKASAFHIALVSSESSEVLSEDPDTIETSRFIVSLLLQKYAATAYINSTAGAHYGVPLGAAVEIGNHHVVRLLLEAGANPNAEDEYSRRPLDLLYWRYCYPATLDYIKEVSPDDKPELTKRLSNVNQHTSEILSLLKSYGAEPNIFRFPAWHQSHPGYRNVEWVIARLNERRDSPSLDDSEKPSWGGLPISIPERPMQFERLRILAKQEKKNKESRQDQA